MMTCWRMGARRKRCTGSAPKALCSRRLRVCTERLWPVSENVTKYLHFALTNVYPQMGCLSISQRTRSPSHLHIFNVASRVRTTTKHLLRCAKHHWRSATHTQQIIYSAQPASLHLGSIPTTPSRLVFADGCTGAGKSHTMIGDERDMDGEQRGICARALRDVFREVSRLRKKGTTTSVHVRTLNRTAGRGRQNMKSFMTSSFTLSSRVQYGILFALSSWIELLRNHHP